VISGNRERCMFPLLHGIHSFGLHILGELLV
jgi:hypothetical protein